jgi:2,3-bisphosphoglycerate-independent phosphoglycerate mutase
VLMQGRKTVGMRPVALVILDGWGYSEETHGNAVAQGHTPNLDQYWNTYPHSFLSASGPSVGLMEGQMGDSNVGHLNIGAGRIVYQHVERINVAIRDGSFFANDALLGAIKHAKDNDGALHLMGLVSPGGVHSHSNHLYALLKMAKDAGLSQVFIHCFLDGRDVPPKSALEYVKGLEEQMREIGVGRIATVSGRYYAMDRDNRWERLNLAYDAMVLGKGRMAEDPVQAVLDAYDADETDEFVLPTVIGQEGKPTAVIEDNDAVIFFNFRSDRARQLTYSFVREDFQGFQREKWPKVHFTSFTQYAEDLEIPFAFMPDEPETTLGKVVSDAGLTQLRIAETEKYAHVTFFFNGGQEVEFPGERRRLIPSPKVATYDLQPEMSAPKVTEAVLEEIQKGVDLIVLNYANLDMVGHTGVMEAALKAVAAVDECLGKVVQAVQDAGGCLLVIADHGNAEQMVDPDTGKPHTAHTSNPVPAILICDKLKDKVQMRSGILADVAPTILELLNIDQPIIMKGESLITKEAKQ